MEHVIEKQAVQRDNAEDHTGRYLADETVSTGWCSPTDTDPRERSGHQLLVSIVCTSSSGGIRRAPRIHRLPVARIDLSIDL